MSEYKTKTMKFAEENSYAAITQPYNKNQHEMLDRVIQDMQGCNFILVEEVGGIAVYRKKTELNTIEE